jgi:peptidoglycan/xylan/chitin deacetylase (PgdA/CDA1 family)
MILLYHKVDIIVPTKWWVSKNAFARQIEALSARQVVSLSEYSPTASNQCVITFDDAYENIYRHAFPILKEKNYPFEVFVNGNLLGGWNRIDSSEPLTRYCEIEQLHEMARAGGRIQWHTNSHRNLTTISLTDAASEISVPEKLRREFPAPHLRWFAYPYGAHTPAIVNLVEQKFDGAVSVCDGSDLNRFQLNRIVATEQMTL